ncbi:MAG: AAA family ATPase [Planktomarina sp.]
MAQETALYNTIAPLRNVSAFVVMVEQLQNRSVGLPGLGVFYGPSGLGKSTASIYAANRFNAYAVQMKSAWTGKKLCQSILREMSIEPAKTIADMVDQIAREMTMSGRPLFIDEADYLIKRKMIELVRDIYESSFAPVVLIGEANMPQNLQTWERVHGRVLSWVGAQAACLADVTQLASIYCPGVTLSDDFQAKLLAGSKNSIRRVCVNLEHAREFCATRGVDHLDAAAWGDRKFFETEAPKGQEWET